MSTSANKFNKILFTILKRNGLKYTKQREQILNTFLSLKGHTSVDTLYEILRKTNPSIGYATVHRSLKLFNKIGIVEMVKVGNQKALYEHKDKNRHHDHLVCVKCGNFTEITSDELENLQKRIASRNNFQIIDHKLIVYGICRKCKNKR
ncbi:MAG: transcriptional repressor [Endomicrobia bacterium]|nr:transcriptional repressor [Endomicrobiia bacterium]MDW8055366.1 Fur family transcriptional regulator [Elusimicrobiota bacterium]